MQDPIISANGQYGIEGLEALIDTGVAVQRGYQLVIADDGKVDVNDAPDLFIFGPPLFGALARVAAKRKDLGKEAIDLSEAEKARLNERAGGQLHKPAFQKILRGLLDMTDGVTELTNPENPVG